MSRTSEFRMRGSWLLLLVLGCVPKIDRGLTAAQRFDRPAPMVLQPDEHSPNVYFHATIHAGSAFDPPGREGLAALTAHGLIHAGAGKRTTQAVQHALTSTGGQLQHIVDREWVTVRLRCPVEHESLCAEIFADALLRPRFDADDLHLLTEQATEYLGSGILADEQTLGEEAFYATVFDAHPYGHPVQGRTGSLSVLSAEHVQQFYRHHYKRSTIAVGLAGAFSEHTTSALADALALLPGGKPPELLLPTPVLPAGRELVILRTDTPRTGFHLGHALNIDRNHPDWPALLVAMTAIDQRARSLRPPQAPHDDAAPFAKRTALPHRHNHFILHIPPTSTSRSANALKFTLSELQHRVDHGLTHDELTGAVHYLTHPSPDPSTRLADAVDAAAANTPDTLTFLPAAIAHVTLDDVHAALQQHIHPQTLWIVALSDDPDKLTADVMNTEGLSLVKPDVSGNLAHIVRDAAISTMNTGLDADRISVRSSQGVFR